MTLHQTLPHPAESRKIQRGPTDAAAQLIQIGRRRPDYLKKAAADEVDRGDPGRGGLRPRRYKRSPAPAAVYRDRCMAENVAWILDHAPPGSKIVLWAQNGHVGKQPGCMGFNLAKKVRRSHGRARFHLLRGSVHGCPAQGVGWWTTTQCSRRHREAWSSVCTTRGCRAWSSILRKASPDAPESSWTRRPHDLRSIWRWRWSGQFFPVVVPDVYDALIYFDKTKASACFRASGVGRR